MSKTRTPKGEKLKYFLDCMKIESDQCIIWKYNVTPKGYGYIYKDGKTLLSHREALIYHGKVPTQDKYQALHKPLTCHNPTCINYRHLYWGNERDNLRDARIDGTITRGANAKHAKLSNDTVLKIFKDNRKPNIIAIENNITPATVRRIKNERIWVWLTNPSKYSKLIATETQL